MIHHTMTKLNRTSLPAAVAAVLVLLLAGAPARAQDGDDDGVLPKQNNGGSSDSSGGSSNNSAPGSLGLSGAAGSDVLDASMARLTFVADQGLLLVDTGATPEAASFVASAGFAFSAGDDSAQVQGDGTLVLQAGLTHTLVAAPDALARVALIVVHEAGTDPAALLAGAQAPSLVLAVGDLPALDLAAAQAAVSRHEAQLPGLAVSVVFLSVGFDGQLHASAARIDPAGGPMAIVIG